MFSDKIHQHPDHQEADAKGNQAAHQQHRNLRTGGDNALQQIFHHFQPAGAQHGGDRQIKAEFCTGCPANTQQQRAQNGSTGAGSAGNQAQRLERTDQ